MATAEEPQGTAGAETPGEAVIKLPAPAPVESPAGDEPPAHEGTMEHAALLQRLDVLLAIFVLAFAFLSASFPVRNSDFLQNLAVGRLMAHGEYRFGSDPFTVAGDHSGWVNHAWLFGLITYAVYQIPQIGPAAIVVLKGLIVTALAGLMLLVSRRPGQRLLVPALVTGLAVLAISPRLFMQPVLLSYLFLALTLWLLDRPTRRGCKRNVPVEWR